MRDVHDEMTDDKTACEKSFSVKIDGLLILFFSRRHRSSDSPPPDYLSSCTVDMGPSAPAGTRSRRDNAKERAAVHPNIELHLRTNAAWALP